SASSFASSSRAAFHSLRVPILCSGISSPLVGLERLPREPSPSSDRTLPGSRNKTCGDPETHRNCPRCATGALAAIFEGQGAARPEGLRGPLALYGAFGLSYSS